jgi:hypothetical protein
MKFKLQITKNGIPLYAGDYDIVDANSFGQACTDACRKIKERHMSKERSIGALMEHLDDGVLNQLNGAHIILEKA